MTNKEKIVELKKCREALIFIKEDYYDDNENQLIPNINQQMVER